LYVGQNLPITYLANHPEVNLIDLPVAAHERHDDLYGLFGLALFLITTGGGIALRYRKGGLSHGHHAVHSSDKAV
jgi:hypothetical protein